MKPYGYKKMQKPPGDGCHLRMKGLSTASKSSKSANRQKDKKEVKDEIRRTTEREEKAAK